MDFFAHQEQARKRTSWLVVFYGLAVAGIIAALYAVVAFALMAANDDPEAVVPLWHPELLAVISGSVLSVVLIGSLIKTIQLAKGGSVVAVSLGGRRLSPATHDGDERRLLNVVEEMALAAGVPVPQVYLMDEERGINAFAAGFTPRDAAIGVTRGCLDQLSRDELQGVIAHEFSHIVNGDMRLNIRLMGILFGILLLTVIGRVLLRLAFSSGGRRSRSGKRDGIEFAFGAAGLALFIIGYIGVFFANLIKCAISRQREFLSDAAAVQYTRNPSGISGALKRIGGLSLGARVANPHADEASHLFFGQVGHLGFMSLFATHPPLKERIQRLDPAFNPAIARFAASVPEPGAAKATAGLSNFAGQQAGGFNMGAATQAMANIPEALLEQAHDAVGARAVIYGLLGATETRTQSSSQAVADGDPEAAALLNVIGRGIASLPRAVRIPLATLAVPALRTMQPAQYQTFRRLVKVLTEADQQIDLFEFAISHMILRHVESAFARIDKAPVRVHRLDDVFGECGTILAGLAAWGIPELAADCYRAGMEVLGKAGAIPLASVSLADIAKALDTLATAAPAIKRRFINACTACILADGSVEVEQAELLRAIADAIDVPMPPMDAAA